MEDLKTEKIKRFMADKVMSDAVLEIILDTFIKIRPRADLGDTEEKAARFIAIQLIQESWKELVKYSPENESEERKSQTNHV